MNKITKSFEINKDLFKVEDNYVCVSDEEIKYGDTWVYISNYGIDEVNNNDVFVLNTIPDSMNWFSKLHDRLNYKKVMFSTQLIYESIPVLNAEDEIDIKVLAEDYKNSWGKSEKTDESYHAFIDGYQKAKDTFKYTEEDLREAINFGYYGNKDSYAYKRFIQSLQQPKEIKSIEVEYEEYIEENTGNELKWVNKRPVILPNGKVKCKINY